jgi:hypothetical protein
MLICGFAVAATKQGLKSGPQVGDKLPGPFNSLAVFSAQDPSLAGKRTDFIEQYGQNPAVLIFAREMTKPLTSLVKKLDAEATKHKSAKLRVIVVMLSDDAAQETNLQDYGEKQGFKNFDLALMEPDGPKHYKLSKEAAVTIVMYKRQKVEANLAFKKGEFNEKDVKKIMANVPKVVSRQ